MARKNYSIDEVLRSLGKKNDVRVNTVTKTVFILTGLDRHCPVKYDLGNGSYGKIDYLVNYCGYTSVRVDRW